MNYQFLTPRNNCSPRDTVYGILPPIKKTGKAIIGRVHYEIKIGIITLNNEKAQSETILQYNPQILNLQNTLQISINPITSIYLSQFSGYDDIDSLLQSIKENNSFYLRRNPTENNFYDVIKLAPNSNAYQLKNILENELKNRKQKNLEIILQNALINPEKNSQEFIEKCLQDISESKKFNTNNENNS